MAGAKRYWSYEQIHTLIWEAAVKDDIFRDFQPTLIVCIAAGGFVPTRILRSCLKSKLGRNVPIQTIGLQLYDVEGADPTTSPVQRVQWLSYGTGPGQLLLQGHKILVVDEVDDSRKTLSCAVTELQRDIQQEQQQHQAEHPGRPWVPPGLGVFVVHNKQRQKLAQLPEDIMQHRYFAALTIDNVWCVYPWDAEDIYAHTATAEAAADQPAGHKGHSSSCALPVAMSCGGKGGGGTPLVDGLTNGAGGTVKGVSQDTQTLHCCTAASASACSNGAVR